MQEDLLAQAKLNAQRDQNHTVTNVLLASNLHNKSQHALEAISEEIGDPLDENTASESENTHSYLFAKETDENKYFTNDPLENLPEKTPTPKVKKGPRRPKKGDSKVTKQPKKHYNTQNRSSTSEVDTSATSSSSKFVINDNLLENSGMNTKFKS